MHCDRLMIIQLYLSFSPHFTLVRVICAADILTRDITKRSIFSQVHSSAPRKPFREAVHSCPLGYNFFFFLLFLYFVNLFLIWHFSKTKCFMSRTNEQ